MMNKRLAWLNISILLFIMVYIYDNTPVGNVDTWINNLWKSLHTYNQHISFGLIVIAFSILVYHLVVVFKPVRSVPPPHKPRDPLDFL